MAKAKKKQAQAANVEAVETQVVEAENTEVAAEAQPELTKEQKNQEKLEQKKAKEKQKAKQAKKAAKKEPKANKVKETVSELKKVTWPTFGKVVRNTLLVLGIVVMFTVVLFGIDFGLSWLYKLLTNTL